MTFAHFILYMRYSIERPSNISEWRWNAMIKQYRRFLHDMVN